MGGQRRGRRKKKKNGMVKFRENKDDSPDSRKFAFHLSWGGGRGRKQRLGQNREVLTIES